MENISWEAQNYLPGVDPETSLPNGSVRTYGHWSGTPQFLKNLKGLWYHYLSFDENGKITEGGDFGDATGLVMSVMPDVNNFLNLVIFGFSPFIINFTTILKPIVKDGFFLLKLCDIFATWLNEK